MMSKKNTYNAASHAMMSDYLSERYSPAFAATLSGPKLYAVFNSVYARDKALAEKLVTEYNYADTENTMHANSETHGTLFVFRPTGKPETEVGVRVKELNTLVSSLHVVRRTILEFLNAPTTSPRDAAMMLNAFNKHMTTPLGDSVNILDNIEFSELPTGAVELTTKASLRDALWYYGVVYVSDAHSEGCFKCILDMPASFQNAHYYSITTAYKTGPYSTEKYCS